jgi:hypothetical protein|tara:strand:+ start:3769 stop:4527 length:759 start_codon:yes stop_codon:yes gene_type:complete
MSDAELLEDGSAVDEANGFDASETPDALEEVQGEPDLMAVVDRLSQIESVTAELDTFRHSASSQIGRMQGLQSAVDKLYKDDASVATMSRVDVLEDEIQVLSEMLFKAFPDEEVKLALKERELDRRLKAIETPTQGAPSAEAEGNEALWQYATTEAHSKLQQMGIDPTTVPQSVYDTAIQSGSPITAIQLVEEWGKKSLGTLDVAVNKRAANNGSVPRASATSSIENLVRAYGEGGDISVAEKRRVMEHLGL